MDWIGLENFITVYARANGTAQPVTQPTDRGPLAPGGTMDFRIRPQYEYKASVRKIPRGERTFVSPQNPAGRADLCQSAKSRGASGASEHHRAGQTAS